MTKNLFLIGYRGTGKTILGKIIAKQLEKEFVDTDKLIVDIAGKSVPEIFSQDGEVKFREIETQALDEASKKENAIISCGGGIITQERNFPILATGIVCLLKADVETIFKRIHLDENRPSLTGKDPKEEIIHLLEVRGPLYERAKDFEVLNSSDRNMRDCVSEIILKFNELNN